MCDCKVLASMRGTSMIFFDFDGSAEQFIIKQIYQIKSGFNQAVKLFEENNAAARHLTLHKCLLFGV